MDPICRHRGTARQRPRPPEFISGGGKGKRQMQQSNGAQRRDRPAAVNRGLCSSFTDEWLVTYNTRTPSPLAV